ncbi:hypothetical protein [Fluviispira vulneris]|uniref:hypothetical protein n=1 Tax=Fluviispira vulneris TaxID=2763012 RepID=UPI001C9515EE|nr:hypothetical protein [Fluviispira vulneris]
MEKDRFKYFFATGFLFSAFNIFLMNEVDNDVNSQVRNIFSSLLLLLTFYFSYVANGRSKGSDFLGKFASIQFILIIKLFILNLIAYFVLGFIIKNFFNIPFEDGSDAKNIFNLLYYSFIDIILFWRTYYHMKDIKRRQIS